MPLYSNLKDWLVACDNPHQCTAMSNAAEHEADATPTWSLSISRGAGPEGALRVGVFSCNEAGG